MALNNLKAMQKEKLLDDDKKPTLLKRKPFAPKKNALAMRLTGGK